MKDFKDYIGLYLGSECIVKNYHSDEWSKPRRIDGHLLADLENTGKFSYQPEVVKPLLRPLSSMTEEEAAHVADILIPEGAGKNKADDIAFKYDFVQKAIVYPRGNGITFCGCLSIITFLLSKHFDLFGLIDAGLAISKTHR